MLGAGGDGPVDDGAVVRGVGQPVPARRRAASTDAVHDERGGEDLCVRWGGPLRDDGEDLQGAAGCGGIRVVTPTNPLMDAGVSKPLCVCTITSRRHFVQLRVLIIERLLGLSRYMLAICDEIPKGTLPSGCQQYAEHPSVVKVRVGLFARARAFRRSQFYGRASTSTDAEQTSGSEPCSSSLPGAA